MTHPESDLIGGRYRLESRIFVGEARAVWRGVDVQSEEQVVVKQYTCHDPLVWRQELTALRLANLPGVVRLLDDGVEGDQAFLVMEVAPGLPFPGRRREGEAVLPVIEALLLAVAGLHARGISHRDLKPGNVFVDDVRVTLLDLGDAGGAELPLRVRPLGYTPRFAAPEQLAGAADGARADVWTLALLAVFALTRALPPRPEDAQAWAQDQLAAHAALLGEERMALLLGALSYQSSERPASALQLVSGWGGSGVGLVRLPTLCERSTQRELEVLFVPDHRVACSGLDAAAALWTRTGGWRDRVESELTAWLLAGVVRWRGDLLSLTGERAEALAAGERVRLEIADPPGLSEVERYTLACVRVLVPHATRDGVLRLGGAVEALKSLEQAGRIWLLPGGEIGAEIGWLDGSDVVDPTEAAREVPSQTPRWLHLSGALRLRDAADVAAVCSWADRSVADGRLGRVIATLAPTLRALDDRGDVDALGEIGRRVGLAGLGMESMEGIEAALRLLEGIGRLTGELAALIGLLRTWRAILRREAVRVSGVRESAPHPDPSVESWRQGALFWDACHGGAPEAQLEAVQRWAMGDDERRGSWLTWRGHRLFERQAFGEAIACLTEALPLRRTIRQQVSTRLNLARMYLQAGQLDPAMEEGLTVVAEARAARLPRHGCAAAYVARDAARRRGSPFEPDPGWIDEAERLHLGTAAALSVVDAAVWLDRGAAERAIAVAERGRGLARRAGARAEELLLRAILLHLDAARTSSDLEALLTSADPRIPPGVRLQALALVWREGVGGDWRAVAVGLARGVDQGMWGAVREIWSVERCLGVLGCCDDLVRCRQL